MKNKLEQLLNTLIQRGWKPRGYEIQGIYCGNRFILYLPNMIQGDYSIRDLVSKSSGLWQFVCENGMTPKENHERVYDVSWGECGVDCRAQIISREPEYWFIESALKDDPELEQFLLNNIIVGN